MKQIDTDIMNTIRLLHELEQDLTIEQPGDSVTAIDAILTLNQICDHFRAKLNQHRSNMSLAEQIEFRKLSQDLRVKEKRYRPGTKSDMQMRSM